MGDDVVPALTQFNPLSIEYSKSVIGEPPSFPGVKLITSCSFPSSIEEIEGEAGTVSAMPDTVTLSRRRYISAS